MCDSPIVANYGDAAFVAVRDNSFGLANDPHDRLLAHEAGHVLFLGHGNGIDDDADGRFDGCDGALYFDLAAERGPVRGPGVAHDHAGPERDRDDATARAPSPR